MIFEIAIIIMIIFFIYVFALYSPILLELVFNLPVLYLLYLFSYRDLLIDKNYYEYVTSFIVALLIFVFTRQFFLKLPFWQITSLLLLTFFFAKLALALNVRERMEHQQGLKKTGLTKFEYGYLKKITGFGRKKR